MESTASKVEIDQFSLKKWDVIITKDSEDPSDIGIPSLVAEDLPGVVCGYHLTIIRTGDSSTARMLHRILMSHPSVAHFFIEAPGITRYGLGQDAIGSVVLCLPPEKDRASVADRIDRETTRIDTLITKKTRFIELLKEKRTALITHAVTKGIDPKAKMRDSQVEWIGEVPEHWSVRPMKSIVSTPITDGPHETPQFHDYGVPFVSAEAISGGFLNFEKIRGYISREAHEAYSKKYKPQKNDIFMIKSGATTGVTAIVDTDIEFNIWSPLAVIRCKDEMDSFFVLSYMRSHSFQEGVSQNWSFGTQQNIGMGVIGDLHVTVPSLAEQRSIAGYIKDGIARIDSLAQKTQHSIDLLKERRAAFITAAVTGQIDLRESA
jgi:type I restriction enzyme S subunit